jgi:hypothetical protein
MKRKDLTLVLLFLGMLFISSCSNDERIVYSCNKGINDYIINNLDEIHCLTRSEWLNNEESYKNPIFSAFTPEQKIQFWNEKLGETLLLDWNESEIAHIQKALDFVNDPDNYIYFDVSYTKSDDELDLFDTFFYKWFQYAYNELGWNKKIIASILATGNRVIDTQGNILTNNTEKMLSSSEVRSCNCNRSAIGDFCTNASCEGSECVESVNGCGLLLIQSCNGICEPF